MSTDRRVVLGVAALICAGGTAGCHTKAPEAARQPPGEVLMVKPPKPVRLGSLGRPRLTEVAGWPSGVVAGDLNHDGRDDVVMLSLLSENGRMWNQMESWLADGSGGFTRGSGLEIGEFVVNLALADFDEDGKLDVVAPRSREKELAIVRGLGDGGFRSKMTIVKTTRKPILVTAAYIDDDNHMDVIVSYFDHLQIFLGDGKGGLKGLTPWRPGQAPEFPIVADIDGDGKSDLFVVLNDENKLLTYRGNGDGTFAPWYKGSACASPAYPGTADFDGDGHPDLAYGCDESIEVRLSRGGGAEFATVTVPASPIEMLSIGDFTGDGAPDLISVGRGGGSWVSTVQLHAGDGNGGFLTGCEGSGGAGLSDPVALDADGDGRLDLAAAYWSGREPGFVGVWSSPCVE